MERTLKPHSNHLIFLKIFNLVAENIFTFAIIWRSPFSLTTSPFAKLLCFLSQKKCFLLLSSFGDVEKHSLLDNVVNESSPRDSRKLKNFGFIFTLDVRTSWAFALTCNKRNFLLIEIDDSRSKIKFKVK